MLDVGRLFEQHGTSIARFLVRRCGDEALAEDLAQQTFLQAFGAAARFEERGAPATAWLYRIARNLLTDHWRTTRPALSLERVPAAGATLSVDVPGALERRLRRLEIERALVLLPPAQREVIDLRFLQGESVRATAARCGCSADAVKQRQRRALVNLSRMLEAA